MQKVSIKSGVFRISIGLTLMIGTMLAGFWLRSPLIVFWLGLALTLSYAAGRAASWKVAWQQGMRGALFIGLPLTYAVQTVLAGLLYLFGLGIATLAKRGDVASALSQHDFAHVTAITTLGVVSGIVLYWMEGGSPPSMFKMANVDDDARLASASDYQPATEDELSLLDERVTPASMFSAIHHSHIDNSQPEETRYLPNEKSEGSDAKIAMAERRLQITLPASLRAIYRQQNGGHVRDLCIVPEGTKALTWDALIMPFTGYSDLIPLESLEFLHSHIEHYANPESEAERFPAGCERMLVLARWYEHTLFVDYNVCDANNEPSIAFVDFEDEAWSERIMRWNTFAEFFSRLRFVES
jgi:hypothetical protein